MAAVARCEQWTMCGRKTRYEKFAEAFVIALTLAPNKRDTIGKLRWRVYICPYCRGFHLSSHAPLVSQHRVARGLVASKVVKRPPANPLMRERMIEAGLISAGNSGVTASLPAIQQAALSGPEGTLVEVDFRLLDDRWWLARMVARLWRK